jgi:hypothetical protein
MAAAAKTAAAATDVGRLYGFRSLSATVTGERSSPFRGERSNFVIDSERRLAPPGSREGKEQ